MEDQVMPSLPFIQTLREKLKAKLGIGMIPKPKSKEAFDAFIKLDKRPNEPTEGHGHFGEKYHKTPLSRCLREFRRKRDRINKLAAESRRKNRIY
jgi:hypothetical protein